VAVVDDQREPPLALIDAEMLERSEAGDAAVEACAIDHLDGVLIGDRAVDTHVRDPDQRLQAEVKLAVGGPPPAAGGGRRRRR
jgi:hypothetical protein